MKPIFVAALLLSSANCIASTVENTTTNAGCPISIHQSRIMFRVERNAQVLKIAYRNVSPVYIIGAKFGLELMDSTGDFSPYLTDESDSERVKPNGNSVPTWDLLTINRESSGYRITVLKVAFSDGTVWQDDGTNKCRVTEDYRK
jgi:hypothetical protein